MNRGGLKSKLADYIEGSVATDHASRRREGGLPSSREYQITHVNELGIRYGEASIC